MQKPNNTGKDNFVGHDERKRRAGTRSAPDPKKKKLNSLIVSAREEVAQQRDRSTKEEAAAPLGPRTTLSNKAAIEVKLLKPTPIR